MAKAKKRRTTIIAICAVAAIVGGVALRTASQSVNAATTVEETDNRIPVDVQSPVVGSISVSSEFIGTVDPNQQVTVYPKANGEVLNVHVNIGDTVEAGDLLFEIDSKALRTSISQTQAALSSAQAKANYNLAIAEKNLATHDLNTEDGYDSSLVSAEAAVKSAENRVQSAELALHTAKRNLERHRDKEEYEFTGVNDYDTVTEQYRDAINQAENTLESAQLGLEQAQDTLRSVQMMSKEQRVNVEDQVKMAELNANLSDQYIALQKLQDDLSNYTVTAPISGVIEQRNIDPHSMATSQTASFVISNKDGMAVSFYVAESALDSLQSGDRVTLEKNGETFPGTISEISTMVDSRSGLYEIKANVQNPPVTLHSGSSVKIFAETEKAENDILIPLDAVYYDSGEPYTYIAAEDESGALVAKKVFLETGVYDAESIQILSGLSRDDQIITTWNSNLVDGAELRLLEPASSETENSEDASSGTGEAAD